MTLPVQNSRDLLPAPKTIDEAMEIAKVLADSILVPKNFQKQPENILVAMMWSHTLGIPVVQGLQYIAVVGGRPCLFGDGMLAICMNSGLLEDIQETLKGSGTEADPLIATCYQAPRQAVAYRFGLHPNGRKEGGALEQDWPLDAVPEAHDENARQIVRFARRIP